jgi:formiminoglutamase
MELAQSSYLAAEAPPWDYDPGRAERLRVHLAAILATLGQAADDLADRS